MDSINIDVLRTCQQWVDGGRACELVTVIRTWGSSPRPEGAMLAIRDDGRVVGSVSGGCIEDDLIDRVRREGITRTRPEIVTYGVTADEAHRFGLPCGGTIQLAVEPLFGARWMGSLLDRLAKRELVARRVNVATGAVTLESATASMGLALAGDLLTTVHGPRWRLLIIGAGQLSQFVARIAVGMDYDVSVCDPREEYRDGWEVDGVEVIHAMPDDLVIDMQLDHRCAVIALTHDPKLDDLALMEALKSPAFYVGAIGSRLNSARRRERLKEFDVSEDQVAKLRGPIGLFIGSKTPPEIAISILAELTAAKNGVALPDAMRTAGGKQVRAEGMSCSIRR